MKYRIINSRDGRYTVQLKVWGLFWHEIDQQSTGESGNEFGTLEEAEQFIERAPGRVVRQHDIDSKVPCIGGRRSRTNHAAWLAGLKVCFIATLVATLMLISVGTATPLWILTGPVLVGLAVTCHRIERRLLEYEE